MFNFVADRVVQGKIYPALTQLIAEPYTQSWREFGCHWPFVTPVRLQEYCEQHGFPYCIYAPTDNLPDDSLYPICLAFFDFDIDYIELLPPQILQRAKNKDFKLLFYYNEGDNPAKIQQRLNYLCDQHDLGHDCYLFISGNTAADQYKNFIYWPDHEVWFWQRNKNVRALDAHLKPRHREFTVLSRLHKSWRATVMADMFRSNILNNSIWSYGLQDHRLMVDNPIEIDSIDGLRRSIDKFLAGAPYAADDLSSDAHNDHSHVVDKHFTDSYCNIVLETMFDLDQSDGTMISEKTYKPIKHGQIFMIVGPHGSLAELRRLGYCTFDSVLDNSYDNERNSTLRWVALRESIKKIQHDLPDIYQQCYSDIMHNQTLFCGSKFSRLNTLYQRIHENY